VKEEFSTLQMKFIKMRKNYITNYFMEELNIEYSVRSGNTRSSLMP
jgi:hypothetical protein